MWDHNTDRHGHMGDSSYEQGIYIHYRNRGGMRRVSNPIGQELISDLENIPKSTEYKQYFEYSMRRDCFDISSYDSSKVAN